MLQTVDTSNAQAVGSFTRRIFKGLYPEAEPVWLVQLFEDVGRLFAGGIADYAPIDLTYHGLKHTLQATVCLVELLAARHKTKIEPLLGPKDFELAVASALLHDSGYLKLRSDRGGTGAKYTYCHVLRSCSFAASFLPTLGASEPEIEAVLGAITCTGPTKEISRLHFRQPIERVIGCALATADYLSQISATEYPDLLDTLFTEFQESDDYVNIPPSKRAFRSAEELKERTPFFWNHYVKPKLEGDFLAVYRFLDRPYASGKNPYMLASEKNIAIIAKRSLAAKKKRLQPVKAVRSRAKVKVA